MKRIIIFRADRLGDFLIISNIIRALKKKYKDSHITVVGSQFNSNFIKSYKVIDKVIIYDKRSSIKEKIKILNDITKNEYFCSLSLDGKSFSNIANFFLKAKFKFGISYRFNLFNFIKWSKPNFIYNYFVFDRYEFFTSKKNLSKIEHLPSILIKLANNLKLNLNSKKEYFYEIKNKALINSKKLFQQKIKKKFVLIHLDEKWNDVLHINEDFFNELINFKNETKYKLVLTSNRNNHLYYKNIKKKLSNHKDILFLENLSLELLERIMSMSSYTVSCHSGFIVQIAGFNKTKVIDVINKKDLIWYSCWKPLNTKHKFVFKSNYNKKIDLNFIFKQIINVSKTF
jgi:ADP-heptose:LPS heptosyltransferase